MVLCIDMKYWEMRTLRGLALSLIHEGFVGISTPVVLAVATDIGGARTLRQAPQQISDSKLYSTWKDARLGHSIRRFFRSNRL